LQMDSQSLLDCSEVAGEGTSIYLLHHYSIPKRHNDS